VAAIALLQCAPAAALMAGSASGTPPDSPTARIDPNVASSPFAGVGAVVINGGVYSGVVIANQYVLTAGHVGQAGPASSMQFELNLGGAQPWSSSVASVTIYPTFNFPYDDLAVLQLTQPVPAGVPVYPMYGGSLATGLTLVMAGYGDSGYGDVGVSVGASATVKRTGENVYDVYATSVDTSGLQSAFFVYDFDGPTSDGPYGGPTLGNTLETLVAPGDSGGPSFVRVNGQLQLFGINTFVVDLNNNPITYTFGEVGGGILAASPRFAAWLQSSTNGALGQQTDTGNGGDGPLPLWALGALGAGLLGVASRRLSGAR
jgi:hypothetical protein